MNEVSVLRFGAFLGLVFGSSLVILAQNINPSSDRNQIKKAIELCEQELPRTQHCIITAIPMEKQ